MIWLGRPQGRQRQGLESTTPQEWEGRSQISIMSAERASALRATNPCSIVGLYSGGDLRPEGIIFDDAHVAETIIRDSYTLRIDPRDNEKIYKGIINLVEPYFSALNASEYLNSAISGTSTHKVILVPPHVMIELSKSASLLELFRANGLYEGRASFALQHLADKLYACSMFISKRGIEISPPFLPSRRIEYLTDNSIRRIYLSATLTSQVDFCRAFGKTPDLKIEPESDASVGERFIVLADKDRILVGGKAELSGPGRCPRTLGTP